MRAVVLAFCAYVLVVVVLTRRDVERRRTLTYVGLGFFLLAIGLIAVIQGQLVVGFFGLALAGIELGLFALIRATRPSP